MSSDLTIRTVNDADTSVAVQPTSMTPATGAAVAKAATVGAMSAKTIAIAVGAVAAVALLVGGLAGGLTAGPSSGGSQQSNTQADGSSALTVGGRNWNLLSINVFDRVHSSWDGDVVFAVKWDPAEVQMSRDAGATFEPLLPRLRDLPDGDHGVAINPDATCIVIGTKSDKIYVSTDEGESFTAKQTPSWDTRIVTMSDDCDTIIVAPFANGNTPVYISRDRGQTWVKLVDTKSIDECCDSSLTRLKCDATCTKIVGWSENVADRTQNYVYWQKGVLISHDSGATWTRKHMGSDVEEMLDMAVDRGASVIVVTGTYARQVSTDSGGSFAEIPATMKWQSCALSAEPSTGNIMKIYAGNEREIAWSANLGGSWETFSIDNTAVAAISCDYDCNTIYVQTERGLYMSREE
jgi:hypothetical protein